MAFENFPYTDLHTLNVDWIIRKLKELEGAETAPVDVSELDRRIRNQAVCLYSGTGWLTLTANNETGMTLTSNSRAYREKASSSMNLFLKLTNNTGSTVAAMTPLVSFDGLDILYDTVMIGITATIYKADNSVITTVPTIYWDSNLNKAAIRLSSYGIADQAVCVISGASPLSISASKLICRGRYPNTLAGEILTHMLNGDAQHPWAPGDFTYSNDYSTRLDPDARATDCSGMIYLAYLLSGMHPSRGNGSHSYWSDGIVLAYADVDEDLDLSNALPGDIIIYHAPGDRTDITHCTLYAGGDVVYEMAYTYPDAEHAIGIQDGKGPYAITSTPAHAYRKDTRGRYLIRVL